MLLVYSLRPLEDQTLTVVVSSADIRNGDALTGTTYPHQAEKIIKSAPSGVRLTREDKQVLMKMVMHQSAKGWENRFRGKDAARLIQDLIASGRGYLWINETMPMTEGDPLKATLAWTLEGDGYSCLFQFDDARTDRIVIPCTPPIAVDPETATVHALDAGVSDPVAAAWCRAEVMEEEACSSFVERLTSRYPDQPIPLPPLMEGRVEDSFVPIPSCKVTQREICGESTLQLLPMFLYGTREIEANADFKRVRFMESDGSVVDAARNLKVESAALRRLKQAGFDETRVSSGDLFARVEQQKSLCLDPEASLSWAEVLTEFFPALEADGWQIRYENGFTVRVAGDEDWYADFEESDRGWMSYEGGVKVDGESVNLLPFVHQFLQQRRTLGLEEIKAELQGQAIPVRSPNGAVVIQGARLYGMIHNLFELFGDGVLDTTSRLRINLYRAAELAEDSPDANWRPPEELVATVRALRGALTVDPVAAPEAFQGELRPYQEQGVGWLRFLREHHLGGILADDMGLGKTVQLIAAILDWKTNGRMEKPAVIVSPTSVLPNWKNELKRFAPELSVVVMHGSERRGQIYKLSDCDIILTTYALLHRDLDIYTDLELSLLVLDEAQAIKNSKSKVTRLVKEIQVETRLALTGTPSENHLGELWSIMDFAQPAFLGGEKEFRRNFRKPIEEDGCRVARTTLMRRIRPLVLRRTKDVVALDLPPKTEIVQTIPLSEAQADLYQTVRMAMSVKIQQEMDAKGLARSQIVILDALMKLRQICCDPRLREKERDFLIPDDSSKLAWLSEVLPELLEEGRRILLFSQFTSMLDLIKPLLNELTIPFVEVRGSTKDRETPVKRFQAGEVPVFLISLKAGGTGLNLTAADTVIHYDPWWNPAVENQATDRAYRIGQDKPVFVYKLVTEGTIEARILELQERKKKITDLSDDQDSESLSFTEADLQRLLAPLGG